MRTILALSIAAFVLTALPVAAQEPDPGLGDGVHVDQAFPVQPALPPGLFAHVSASAAGLFADGGKRVIFAADLWAKMQGGQKVFIIDTRPNAQYQAGHIPGAVNIEQANLFKPEYLSLLPADGTQIVVACHTGHTGSQVNAVLNVLGYNAWALRFGMMGWSAKTAMTVGSGALPAQTIYGFGGPLTVGANP